MVYEVYADNVVWTLIPLVYLYDVDKDRIK